MSFFRFWYNILYWIYANGEKARKGKVINDDIYNRIIEFKAKNDIIKMNKNYSNVNKKYGELNTSVSIMLMTKITLHMRMWGPSYNKSGFIASLEKACTSNYAQITMNLHRKGNFRKF